MATERTIIEVNGVKLEVDLRSAKRVDTLTVGDRVKVLTKKSYEGHQVYPGTVVGFEPFEKLPTVIVAYLKRDYNGATIEFVYFNAQTKDTEIVKSVDEDHLDLNKQHVLNQFDAEIEKKLAEVEDLRRKRAYFLGSFRMYWEQIQRPEAAEA